MQCYKISIKANLSDKKLIQAKDQTGDKIMCENFIINIFQN